MLKRHPRNVMLLHSMGNWGTGKGDSACVTPLDGLFLQWEYQSKGNSKAMGILKQWEFQSNGNLKAIGISKKWEFQSNRSLKDVGISEQWESHGNGNLTAMGISKQWESQWWESQSNGNLTAMGISSPELPIMALWLHLSVLFIDPSLNPTSSLRGEKCPWEKPAAIFPVDKRKMMPFILGQAPGAPS